MSINMFKGINVVTHKTERILIAGQWTIELPKGYAYTFENSIIGDDNIVRIKSENNQMDVAYDVESQLILNIKDAMYSFDSEDGIDEIEDLYDSFGYTKYTIIDTDCIKVSYNHKEWVSDEYSGTVFVSFKSLGIMYQGIFQCNNADFIKAQTDIVTLLSSISLADTKFKESFIRESSYKTYFPDFNGCKYVDIGDEISIPIPKGYKYKPSQNAGQITKKGTFECNHVIINEEGSFDNNGTEYSAEFVFAIQDNYSKGEAPVCYEKENAILYFSTIEDDKSIRCDCMASDNCAVIAVEGCGVDDQFYYRKSFAIVYKKKLRGGFFRVRSAKYTGDSLEMQTVLYVFTTEWLKRIKYKGKVIGDGCDKGTKTADKRIGFKRAIPDEKLYDHYSSLRSHANRNIPGVTFITNQNGTENAFVSFRDMANDDFDDDGCPKDLFERVILCDTEPYALDKEAREMAVLFRVNKNVFNLGHDRECEINEGMVQKAYMISAFRSFVWTLFEYCKENNCKPENIGIDVLTDMVSFISQHDFLNYKECDELEGICNVNDLHVYYIPDKVSKSDRRELLPDEEDIERIEHLKSIFPNYNEIISGVASLEKLRHNMEFVYPAIKRLWVKLASDRDFDKELTGTEADIVYVWCAYTIAAKEPFYHEDGPVRCFFSRINTGDFLTVKTKIEGSLNDSAVEFTKTEDNSSSVMDDGSVLIDSEIVKNWYSRQPQTMKKAIITADIENLHLSEYSELEEVECIAGVTKIPEYCFARCENLKKVTLCSGIREVGSCAFFNCENLTEVYLPDTLESIEDSAFSSCHHLDEIVLPKSLKLIGKYAFGRSGLKTIELNKGIKKIENFAFSNCKYLKDVFIGETAKTVEWGDRVFDGSYQAVIHASKKHEKLDLNCPMYFETKADTEAKPETNTIENDPSKIIWLYDNICLQLPEGFEYKQKEENSYELRRKDSNGEDVFSSQLSVTELSQDEIDVITQSGYENYLKQKFSFEKSIPMDKYFPTVLTVHNDQYRTGDNDVWDIVVYSTYIFMENAMSTLQSVAIKGYEKQVEDDEILCHKYILENIHAAEEYRIDSGILREYTGTDTYIKIPSTVNTIDSFAFCSNNTLKRVDIDCESVGNHAFENLSTLEVVKFGSNLRTIGEAAFCNCGRLLKIQFAEGLVSIKKDAFNGCNRALVIFIPKTVETIEEGAFANRLNDEYRHIFTENAKLDIASFQNLIYGYETVLHIPENYCLKDTVNSAVNDDLYGYGIVINDFYNWSLKIEQLYQIVDQYPKSTSDYEIYPLGIAYFTPDKKSETQSPKNTAVLIIDGIGFMKDAEEYHITEGTKMVIIEIFKCDRLYIPQSVERIFLTEKASISLFYVKKGSYAESYVIDHGIEYKYY